MRVLATYSIKGGVGKTTSAVNLADHAARTGWRVLVWDLDPQGAATFFLRVKPKIKGGARGLVGRRGALEPHVRASDVPGVHLLPADFSLRHLDVLLDVTPDSAGSGRARLGELLDPISDRYDVAILDCPPGITLGSESVFGAADALLVPTVPSTLSARTLEQLDDFLRAWPGAPRVLPFLTMVDRRRRMHRDVAAALIDAWPALLRTVVPSSASVERMGVERAPLSAFAPRGVATSGYRDLWAEIADRLITIGAP
ncbi:MAG: ParA family protein [Ilumatobacteraceae bacterium]